MGLSAKGQQNDRRTFIESISCRRSNASSQFRRVRLGRAIFVEVAVLTLLNRRRSLSHRQRRLHVGLGAGNRVARGRSPRGDCVDDFRRHLLRRRAD